MLKRKWFIFVWGIYLFVILINKDIREVLQESSLYFMIGILLEYIIFYNSGIMKKEEKED